MPRARSLQNLLEFDVTEVDESLRYFRWRSGKVVGRAALRATATSYRKTIRRMVNAQPQTRVSGDLKRAAKRTIGSTVRGLGKTSAAKGAGYEMKVGFGVGKERKRSKKSLLAGSKNTGVGLGHANIHWATMGTVERRTSSGANRGEMPAALAGIIPAAIASGGSDAKIAAKKKAQQTLQKEIHKARKKR